MSSEAPQNVVARGSALRHSVAVVVGVLFTGIVGFHLASALIGKPLFRPLHLGTALEYANGRVDLLRPVVVGFNAGGTPTAQELPLWQATVACLLKLTGSRWYGWGTVVSLVFFATGLWPFFQLVRQYAGERSAWWALAFYLAQPLIVLSAGSGGTDSFCLTVTLWFLYFADQMIRSGNLWWWLPTTLFACVSALSKLPFFMAAGLCSATLLLLNRVRTWQLWLGLITSGALAAAALAAWTHHTNGLAAQAEFPYYELRLTQNPAIVKWYFGDLQSRLIPSFWLRGGWRFFHATLGSLPLVLLLGASLFRPGQALPKFWLLATLLTTLVFTQVVLVHWHYYLMWCPAVAWLCGATIARWEDFWSKEMPAAWLRVGLTAAALALSALDGIIAMKVAVYFDPYPRRIAEVIQQYTKPDDKIVLLGSEWGGEELFRSGRKGLLIYSLNSAPAMPTVKGLVELLGNEADLHRLKDLGYNKLVLLSESPVRFAAEAVNPGSRRRRIFYPATVSPAVDAWPEVYRSEDILIRQIP